MFERQFRGEPELPLGRQQAGPCTPAWCASCCTQDCGKRVCPLALYPSQMRAEILMDNVFGFNNT